MVIRFGSFACFVDLGLSVYDCLWLVVSVICLCRIVVFVMFGLLVWIISLLGFGFVGFEVRFA